MARTFSLMKVSIWGDDEFLELSMPAQWLYFHLVSHPDLSYAGVADWRPGRIAGKAVGMTAEVVRSAGEELVEKRFLVIDEGTEEVLIRSFVRNDGLLKQVNMGAAVAKAYATVASRTLRAAIATELQRLHSENPTWGSWRALDDVLGRSVVVQLRAV